VIGHSVSNRGDYQKIIVHSHKHTYMSSSCSSLDWVLSQLAYFTVRRFICVCILFFFHTAYMSYHCNVVGWTWWDWRL